MGTTARHTEFHLHEVRGHYQEALLRAEFHGVRNVTFGLEVPAILLSRPGEREWGIGNAVALAEVRPSIGGRIQAGLGMQIEFPLGSAPPEIATRHVELLPYAFFGREIGPLAMRIDGGFRFGIEEPGSAHDHSHSGEAGTDHTESLFVNPHPGNEALYRVAVGFSGAIRPTLILDGQHVLEGDGASHHMSGGAGLRWDVTERLQFAATLERSLSNPARFDWRSGSGVTYRF